MKKMNVGVKESFKRVGILGLIGFIIPIFVKGMAIDMSELEIRAYPIFTSPVNVDLFGASKARLLLVGIILISLQFLFLFFKNQIELKVTKNFAFFGVFYGFLLTSTLMSDYQDVVYLGFSDRYEGFYVYSYYIMLVFFTYFLVQSVEDIIMILDMILLSVIPIFIIGVLEANDIFPIIGITTEPIIFGFIPREYDYYVQLFLERIRSGISPGFDIVSSTLYNPNYLGVYAITMFLVASGLLNYTKSGRRIKIYGLFVLLSFSLLLLSGSKTSFYILICFMLLDILIQLLIKNRSGIHRRGVIIIGCIVCFIVINMATYGEVRARFFLVPEESFQLSDQVWENGSIETDNDIITKNVLTSIDIQEEGTYIKDNTSGVTLIEKSDKIVIENKAYIDTQTHWSYEYLNDTLLLVRHNSNQMYFEIMENGKIGVYGPRGLVDFVPSPTKPMINGNLFTSRGYIWSLALELIKESPFIGYGPDTLPIITPVDDLVSRVNYSHDAGSIALNPHNMYIQLAIIGGVFALLGFLLFLAAIYITGLKQFIKKEVDRDFIMVLFLPLSGFLAVSLLNDTIIGTGVILYLLIGLGAVSVFKVNPLNKSRNALSKSC